MDNREPEIGDIVIYFHSISEGGQGVPAIVTHVWSAQTVNLQIFTDSTEGVIFRTSIVKGTAGNTWNFRDDD